MDKDQLFALARAGCPDSLRQLSDAIALDIESERPDAQQGQRWLYQTSGDRGRELRERRAKRGQKRGNVEGHYPGPVKTTAMSAAYECLWWLTHDPAQHDTPSTDDASEERDWHVTAWDECERGEDHWSALVRRAIDRALDRERNNSYQTGLGETTPERSRRKALVDVHPADVDDEPHLEDPDERTDNARNDDAPDLTVFDRVCQENNLTPEEIAYAKAIVDGVDPPEQHWRKTKAIREEIEGKLDPRGLRKRRRRRKPTRNRETKPDEGKAKTPCSQPRPWLEAVAALLPPNALTEHEQC